MQRSSLGPQFPSRPLQILLVEDNPGDVRLMKEALGSGRFQVQVHSVLKGEDAIAFLSSNGEPAAAQRPDIILLDLNLPGMDGREVLARVKHDPGLRRIPVIVLTTSQSQSDVQHVYDLHANCYIQKPVDFDEYIAVVEALEEFWFKIVRLPS